MVQFFETRMGQKFYTSDVPRIATALERIATALEKQPKVYRECANCDIWVEKDLHIKNKGVCDACKEQE